ncbi:hypothetical protein KTD28_06735 [Burkholderia gladioli]|uniref:hypothetical protein n=1 Tax=Burkholderia gladioli TaxID=28095 RepID=UPI00050F1F71|nr:hypothetical protein [Burkholderia gladioli]KGE08513.1 hypothetical protein LA03_20460 [Burkholderia gladioli]MBU9154302.1 hypothetical protein [Burkholderia gladioli]MBU9169323.1 hypothetical protein [Burkholderia gladioli]
MDITSARQAHLSRQRRVGAAIIFVILTSIAGVFFLVRHFVGSGIAEVIASGYALVMYWGGFSIKHEIRTFDAFVNQQELCQREKQAAASLQQDLKEIAAIMNSKPETAQLYEDFKRRRRASIFGGAAEIDSAIPWR